MFGFLFVIGIGSVIFLWRLLAVKELALAAAKSHCQSVGVQFLDGSVVLSSFKAHLNQHKRPAILQQYQFEFSTTGERRYLGWVNITGKKIISVELQPHSFPEF